MSVNKVIILGYLGQDPELKYTPGGVPVCSFSIATSETWRDKTNEKQERTEWHKIIVWNKLAELCGQYLSKGRQVFLEGSLQTRAWEDKNGEKRFTTEVVAKTIQFIGANKNSEKVNIEDQDGFNNAIIQDTRSHNFHDTSFTHEDIPF